MNFSNCIVLLLSTVSLVDAFTMARSSSRHGIMAITSSSSKTVHMSRFSLSMVDDDAEVGVMEDEEEEEDYLVTAGELEGDDQEDAGAEDDGEPPAWYASQQRIEELRLKHRRHETDVGSPEFQVAGMTERISYLTKHLQKHPKDFSTRRGLVALVNKRRRLLNYLFKENEQKYVDLVNDLGIRHKPPSKVDDRVEKYGRFPLQKAIKKHLVKKR